MTFVTLAPLGDRQLQVPPFSQICDHIQIPAIAGGKLAKPEALIQVYGDMVLRVNPERYAGESSGGSCQIVSKQAGTYALILEGREDRNP